MRVSKPLNLYTITGVGGGGIADTQNISQQRIE